MQTIGDIVARNLRALRVERGLTVSELARRSGVAKGTVSKLEAGQATNPTVETLWALADALGASLSELIVADTPPSRVGRLAEAEWIDGDVLRARIVDKLAGREVHDVSHVRFVPGARRDAGPHRRGAFAHAFVLAGTAPDRRLRRRHGRARPGRLRGVPRRRDRTRTRGSRRGRRRSSSSACRGPAASATGTPRRSCEPRGSPLDSRPRRAP